MISVVQGLFWVLLIPLEWVVLRSRRGWAGRSQFRAQNSLIFFFGSIFPLTLIGGTGATDPDLLVSAGNPKTLSSRSLFVLASHRMTVLCLILGLITSSLTVFMPPLARAPSSYVPHAPILITGNAGFTTPNGVVSGSGTSLDPYIISGWDINASTAVGISISNTGAYFIIRNVNVHSGMTNYHKGVFLSNVVNGRVENSFLSTNYSGIWLDHSNRITVSNDTLVGNSSGADLGVAALHLVSTNNTMIVNNNATANIRHEILVLNSENVTVTGNIASITGGLSSNGVYIGNSKNLTLTGNTISRSENFGLLLDSSTGVHVYHNNFTANAPNAQDVGGSGNSWDNGYPSGGNYWDDYWYYFLGKDDCSGSSQNVCNSPDGIGDVPYVLQSGQHDRYPLVVHSGAVLRVKAPPSIVQGQTVSFNVTVENLGNVVEKNFTLVLDLDSMTIGSRTLSNFSPCGAYGTIPGNCFGRIPTVISFSWTAGGLLSTVAPGNYALTARLTRLPLQASPLNNASSTTTRVLAAPPFSMIGPFELSVIISAVVAGVVLVLLAWFRFIQPRRAKDPKLTDWLPDRPHDGQA